MFRLADGWALAYTLLDSSQAGARRANFRSIIRNVEESTLLLEIFKDVGSKVVFPDDL